MAQARLSVRKIREVLRLKAEARLSDRQIAAVVGSARSTVQECLRRARAAGIGWPLPQHRSLRLEHPAKSRREARIRVVGRRRA